MADLVINGKSYNGVSSVKIPNSGGTQETFIQPSGDKNISANGTVDVTNFARAIVNVPTSVSGSTTINANGTYNVAAFAQAIVNVPTAGGITNIDTGTATPSSTYALDIPIDTTKGTPVAIMTWSDDGYNNSRVCCHIGFLDTRAFSTRLLRACNYLVGAKLSDYDEIVVANQEVLSKNQDGSITLGRLATSANFETTDTFHYIVFYKPVGDLSFGGASA